jgi:squalene-associated FAD-dependent desaturase
MKVAVIGAGWAGLAAAVHARQAGHDVTVLEMAGSLGGRARTVHLPEGPRVDNGQHILIGAYTHTLSLMQTLGVDLTDSFDRRPLAMVNAQGQGLRLKKGHPVWAFGRAVWSNPDWTVAERWALCAIAVRWRLSGFRCPPQQTVADLTRTLPSTLREDFIDPLCVAALNTPASQASGIVFLRVLKDALLSGPGASDLLLPRKGLGSLLPEPAQRWLDAHGATVHTHQRVQWLRAVSAPSGATGWQVATTSAPESPVVYDHVVLACTANEAARLTSEINADWSASAAALRYEPIITVTLHCLGTRLPEPMLALTSDSTERPAQFVFDLGQLGGLDGALSFVISGAAPWVQRGTAATEAAVLRQAQTALKSLLVAPPVLQHCLTEKRATFACTPGLRRPPASIAPGLWAAADYVQGPYPATLEGAVRSAVDVVHQWNSR